MNRNLGNEWMKCYRVSGDWEFTGIIPNTDWRPYFRVEDLKREMARGRKRDHLRFWRGNLHGIEWSMKTRPAVQLWIEGSQTMNHKVEREAASVS
jgi:hypothetical protein